MKNIEFKYAGPVANSSNKVKRNAQCKCNSGKKFKNCCLPKRKDDRDDWVMTPFGFIHETDPKLTEILASLKNEVAEK